MPSLISDPNSDSKMLRPIAILKIVPVPDRKEDAQQLEVEKKAPSGQGNAINVPNERRENNKMIDIAPEPFSPTSTTTTTTTTKPRSRTSESDGSSQRNTSTTGAEDRDRVQDEKDSNSGEGSTEEQIATLRAELARYKSIVADFKGKICEDGHPYNTHFQDLMFYWNNVAHTKLEGLFLANRLRLRFSMPDDTSPIYCYLKCVQPIFRTPNLVAWLGIALPYSASANCSLLIHITSFPSHRNR